MTFPLLVLFGGAFDTGIPAAAGHYSFQSLFGYAAPPGVNFQIQVVQITHQDGEWKVVSFTDKEK